MSLSAMFVQAGYLNQLIFLEHNHSVKILIIVARHTQVTEKMYLTLYVKVKLEKNVQDTMILQLAIVPSSMSVLIGLIQEPTNQQVLNVKIKQTVTKIILTQEIKKYMRLIVQPHLPHQEKLERFAH